MNISRRHFIKNMGMGLASAGLAAEHLACNSSISSGGSEKLLVDNPSHPEPAPLGYDRLPLSWYEDTVRRLKARVSAEGIDAVLLGSLVGKSAEE